LIKKAVAVLTLEVFLRICYSTGSNFSTIAAQKYKDWKRMIGPWQFMWFYM